MIAEIIDMMGWDVERAVGEWSAEQAVELLKARMRRNERIEDEGRLATNLQNLSGVM